MMTELAPPNASPATPAHPGGGVLPIYDVRGCADYMGGFFLEAKYVDMGIFWDLYPWVSHNSSKIVSKPPIIIENHMI